MIRKAPLGAPSWGCKTDPKGVPFPEREPRGGGSWKQVRNVPLVWHPMRERADSGKGGEEATWAR